VLRKKRGKGSTSLSRKKQKKKTWDVVSVAFIGGQVNEYLADGWEPLAVVAMPDGGGSGYSRSFIYLRKKVAK